MRNSDRLQNTDKQFPIDFVITWVNGSDSDWNSKRIEYLKNNVQDLDSTQERYRDWNLFNYWFRAVEKYAPWVRTIHLVTDHQIPEWLNCNHSKIHIVNHEDIIPKEYLPLYNSNAIEIFLSRIPGLSEHFVYFNDDVFLTDAVTPETFFMNGLPCDMLALQPVVANPANEIMTHIFQNNALVLARHFNKWENMKAQRSRYYSLKYPFKYWIYNHIEHVYPLFTGFYSVHGAMPLCKSTFDLVWKKENTCLIETAKHRFRSKDDVSVYLFREWQKLSGQFYPVNAERGFVYYELENQNQSLKKLRKLIQRKDCQVLCMNDSNKVEHKEKVQKELKDMFEQFLPDHSSFEI